MNEVNATTDQPALCCGGRAPQEPEACCVQDAEAKAAGQTACCAPADAASSCCA